MLSQRTVVPPGFAELAADAQLAAQLGTVTFGALVRLCHLAEPSADVPGGWCTTIGAEELAEALGVSRKTAAKWLSDLQSAGLVAKVPGRPLGRGLGSTPTRYFITAIAGLTHPGPSGDPHRPGRVSRGKVSTGKDAQVIAYPVQRTPASVTATIAMPNEPAPVVDVSSSTHQTADPDTPTWLSDALRSIGFIGPLPAGTLAAHDAATVLRVVEQIRSRPSISSPAAYLNWLLRSGGSAVSDFLADGPHEGEPKPELMGVEKYLQLRSAFPAWADQVHQRAAASAQAAGVKVDLKVILAAAATVDVTDARVAGEGR